MRKQSKIRWRRQDKKDIVNAVRKFNAKLTREIKKNPDIAMFLPARITTDEIRSRIQTRQDFNRELNSLNRFSRKGSTKPIITPQGLTTTQWEKNEIGIRVRTINRRRARMLKEANLSHEKGNTYLAEEMNLVPKNFNINEITVRNWDKYKKGVFKQSLSNYIRQGYENYKRGYLSSLQDTLSSNEYRQRIAEIVESLDSESVYKAGFYDPRLAMEFRYSPEEQERVDRLTLEMWEVYLNEIQR